MKTFKEYLEENILQGSGLEAEKVPYDIDNPCLLYTSPSPRDLGESRMPSSA